MQINLAERLAIERTKDAITNAAAARNAVILLNGYYSDADYGSEPMDAIEQAHKQLVETINTLKHALAVIEGRV